ncbi:MAG: CBS domain-containing protein [Nitrospirota bacterium]|nr:CBS domain-containing protein [Nitrospirota bacterium]
MITVSRLLKTKTDSVWTIRKDAMAYEALRVMEDKDIGALLVLDNEGILIGVFSERDYARKVILKGRSSKETPVSELMSEVVYAVSPEHTINDCMSIMTTGRVRHLPVKDNGTLVGIVSIGDVVNAIISAQETTIKDLENYITGGIYAGDNIRAS